MPNGFSPYPTDKYPTDKDGHRQILPMFPAHAKELMSAIVLVVGDTESAEMRGLVEELKTILSTVRFVFLRSFASIATEFAEGEFPDMIVVLQNWSDEYSTTDVTDLFAFAPLARVIVCYGLLCESDGRNRNIWPIAVRIPVWSALARIEREWQSIQSKESERLLPLSASRDEVFAADHPPISMTQEPQKFLIDSPDPGYTASLQERLEAAGHNVDEVSPLVLLIDIDPWSETRANALSGLRQRHPDAEAYALTSWPTPTLISDLAQQGIIRVIH